MFCKVPVIVLVCHFLGRTSRSGYGGKVRTKRPSQVRSEIPSRELEVGEVGVGSTTLPSSRRGKSVQDGLQVEHLRVGHSMFLEEEKMLGYCSRCASVLLYGAYYAGLP